MYLSLLRESCRMKGLDSVLVFFFCPVLVCHASVGGVIISQTVRQNLILTHRHSVNETALIFEFLTENFLPEVIGKTIEKIKLELPSNLEEMLPMENITVDYPMQTRNCSLQQLSVQREDAELTLTLDSLSYAHIDQDQKKLVLCVIMTRQVLIDSFQEYTSAALVISTRGKNIQYILIFYIKTFATQITSTFHRLILSPKTKTL